MKPYCICFFFLFFFQISGFAQDVIRCGTPGFESLLQKKFPAYKKSIDGLERLLKEKKTAAYRIAADAPLFTIPVVVHVLYNTTASNISDDRIISQIKVINDDYARLNADTVNTPTIFKPLGANAGLLFVLANRDPQGSVTNGILRKYVPNKSFIVDDYTQDSLLKATSRWPSDQYLNIWVTTLSNSSNNKVLGYTFNPSSYTLPDLYSDVEASLDGVVVDYTTFGLINSTSKYNLGRTTTHEVGHWLGLRHIWGDSYCGDDYVDDTPPQEDSNLNLSNTCLHYSNCIGSSTLDMSANYMDYSPDKCMNIFTIGQVGRMRTVMATNDRRIKIQNSYGYCPVEPAPLPIFQGFENSINDENWSVINPDNDNTFIQGMQGGFNESNHSLQIMNTASSQNKIDYYQSVPIDLQNAENPILEFSLAYAPDAAKLTDSLVISYSLNCKDFIYFTTFYGADLITTAPADNFIPGAKDWEKIKLSLKPLSGRISQIRFENYSKAKNNLYLDDINIYDSKTDLQLLLYPNPVTGSWLTAEIIDKEPVIAEFTIFSVQGKLLKKIKVDSKDFRKKINVSDIANGLYILKADLDGKTIIKKFIVEN